MSNSIVQFLICIIGCVFSQNTTNGTIIYVSKYGTDSEDCGLINNPCGTLYIAFSNLDVLKNITTIYMIDGQNLLEIESHMNALNVTNDTDFYSPCLPKINTFQGCEFDLSGSTCDYDLLSVEYTVIFDHINIQSMGDWYPSKCDEILKQNNSNTYTTFFDQFSSPSQMKKTANFINLIVDNYHFTSLTLFGDSGKKSESDQTNNPGTWKTTTSQLDFNCYNCKFINLLFSCSNTSHFISADSINIINSTISNVSITCKTISSMFQTEISLDGLYYQELLLQNVYVSNIWMEHSLFYVAGNNVNVYNCTFNNIYAGYDIIGEHSERNIITIYNSNFFYIHNNIYLSNSETSATETIHFLQPMYMHIENVNFIIDQAGTSIALFEADVSTNITFVNVNIYYEYDLKKHCRLYSIFLTKTWCKNPQSFITTYGESRLINASFSSNMNEFNNLRSYQQFVQNQTDSDAISYYFEGDDYGLINNFGDSDLKMIAINVKFSPFIFHRETIVSTKSIVLNHVDIVHNNIDEYTPNNFSHLESDIFLSFFMFQTSGLAKQISVINCNLQGAREYMFRISISDRAVFQKLEITNSTISDSITLVSADNLKEINIQNSYFANAYYQMFALANVNNTIIQSSFFGSYGMSEIFWITNCDNVTVQNDIFKLTENSQKRLTLIETETFLSRYERSSYSTPSNIYGFVIRAESVTNIQIISNYFDSDNGYNRNVSPFDIAAIILEVSGGCLSNNTFKDYALHLWKSNLTSCYKPNMMEDLCKYNAFDTPNCCNRYGSINEEFNNLMGYFHVNNSRVQPITADTSPVNIALENIQFQFSIWDNRSLLILPNVDHLLFTDVVINSINNISFGYQKPKCNILCNQIMKHKSLNSFMITRIETSCNLYINDKNNKSYANSLSSSELISHGTAHNIALHLDNNGLYYPGEFMTFNHSISDKFGNKIEAYGNPIGLKVSVIDNNDKIIYEQTIHIDETGNCSDCQTGVYIPSITLNNTGQTFVLSSVDNNGEFMLSDVSMTVKQCPRGFGVDIFESHCSKCPVNYYQIMDNSTTNCSICQDRLNNYKCNGRDNIVITQHHWIAIKGLAMLSENMFKNSEDIVSGLCPGFCCQLHEGCDYLRDIYSLCAKNRDPNSIMCSLCLDGYSESMNSSRCVKCHKVFYGEYLLFPLILSLFMYIYFLVTNRDKIKKEKKKERNYNYFEQRLKSPYFMLMVKTILGRNILYYQQAISQILSSETLNVLFLSFSSIFNLTMFTSTNTDGSWCFIDGLTAKYKILIDLLVPLMIVLFVSMTYLVTKLFNLSIMLFKKRLNYTKTCISMILLVIGKVLEVLFKLLSCQTIGNKTLHFYFAYEECYGTTWILSLISLFIIICMFGLIFIKIKQIHNLENQNKNNDILRVLSSKYKPNYYYWEMVLLVRRICIAMFAVYSDNVILQFIFILIMFYFLYVQNRCQPFIIHQCNNLENILLSCLTCVIILQLPQSLDSTFKMAFYTFFILFPFLLLVFYIIDFKQSESLSLFRERIKFLLLYIIWYYASYSKNKKRSKMHKMVSISNKVNSNIPEVKSTHIQAFEIDDHNVDQATIRSELFQNKISDDSGDLTSDSLESSIKS